MNTYTCLIPTDDERVRALVVEADSPENAAANLFTTPAIHTMDRTIFVMPGDFRGYQLARLCLQEVSYFLAGASHLTQDEMADYVTRAINQLDALER